MKCHEASRSLLKSLKLFASHFGFLKKFGSVEVSLLEVRYFSLELGLGIYSVKYYKAKESLIGFESLLY